MLFGTPLARNGAAYHPGTNLLYLPAVDWCSTVQLASDSAIADRHFGQPWSASGDTVNIFGRFDPKDR